MKITKQCIHFAVLMLILHTGITKNNSRNVSETVLRAIEQGIK